MNRKKKKILAAALAVCVVATLSFSTLAWFNATQSVTNRFLVASASSGGGSAGGGGGGGGGGGADTRTFSVDLWEYAGSAPLPAQGSVPEADKDRDGMQFERVLPGVEYNKHPVVENTGEQDQWIRALVTISGASVWKQALPAYALSGFFNIGTEWTAGGVLEDSVADTITYYFYLNAKLRPEGRATLFTQVKLPGEELTQENLAGLNGSFDITLRADAVQGDDTGDNAKNAFETVVNWPASKVAPDQ